MSLEHTYGTELFYNTFDSDFTLEAEGAIHSHLYGQPAGVFLSSPFVFL